MSIKSLDVDGGIGGTWNRPKKFPGTAEEAAANLRSHAWQYDRYGDGPDDVEVYCDDCLAKPWHEGARWPCGTKVPREIVSHDKEGRYRGCDDAD